MRVLFLIFSLCWANFNLNAQSAKYQQVKISLEGRNIAEIAALGLEADHGEYAEGRFFINIFSEAELQLVTAAGFTYEVLIEDYIEHYNELNRNGPPADYRTAGDCEPTFYDYETPVNYEEGTLNGYFTYQEILDNLDAMHAQYPNLITERAPISEILTHDGNSIFWVRVSDNPNTDETDEPEVLYDALHHAREPNSLSQMIFYLWYLLENYEDDPEVQFLVDNTEMYFVPCVNPDGYLHNEANFPYDILWRKNRRDNGDGTFGVDLNRNYGFEWGFDNNGSSPDTESETYRGLFAFSEPETQNMKLFCEAHEFEIGLNYHTYGNLLIYPWGYSDTPTDESEIFFSLAEAMTNENNYTYGTGSETVGYVVNGNSDDWMYGEQETKEAIYAMTPEVGFGAYQFWPPQWAIDNLNKSTVSMNLVTAHLVHVYGEATDLSTSIVDEFNGAIDFSIKRYGLKDGDMTVTLTGLTANVISTGGAQVFDLTNNESMESSISYMLSPDMTPGEEVRFLLSIDNGTFVNSETLVKFYGSTLSVFAEDGNVNDWNVLPGGEWGQDILDYVSAPYAISDSPQGDYEDNAFNQLRMEEPIDLSEGIDAILNFWAKWDIEASYDYTQVLASIDGINFIPLCGLYTKLGTDNQDEDQPIFDGTQQEWVYEEMDLSDFAGEPEVWLEFRSVSDGFVEGDGFKFDDVEVTVLSDEIIESTIDLAAEDFIFSSRPNPVREFVTITFSENLELDGAHFMVHNQLGALVFEQILGNEKQLEISTVEWTSGLYYYQLMHEGQVKKAQKIIVVD